MGDNGALQLSKEELQELLQEAAQNAVRASQRASIKRKLSEHIAAVEKIHVSHADDMPRTCYKVPPLGISFQLR